MQIEIPEQDKLTSSLLNNVGIAIGADASPDTMATAQAMVRRAMALNPLDVGRRLNLAQLLIRSGEDGEAEGLLSFALKHDESLWLGWQLMGVIRTHAGALDEATACFKRAYDIDPNSGQRKFDLAAAYLRAGDFARGLPLYEHRHEILPNTGPLPNAPQWNGEKTGHLAVWGDQGHGDRIMFARFLPWARERADKITFLTDPASVPLLYGYSRICEIACGFNDGIQFDHQVSLASLPLFYGLTPDNIPPDPGLLSVAETQGQLGAPGLKIGIAWFGNPAFPGNDMRTVPFHELLALAADPRNSIFSLQCGARSGDIAHARAQRIVHDLSGQIEGEWSHTAAVIKNLDLVVTSCTAIAHLAGALGVPTFVMLPRFADWRWFSGRDDSPWYPRTRLFRQSKVGEWRSVVARVSAAVDELHRRRSLSQMLDRVQSSSDRGGVANIAAGEPDVTDVLRRVLRPGDCFVDVGANEGMHSIEAARLVGEAGSVIAFEPGSNVTPRFVEATTGAGNVELVARPLWNEEGPVRFHLCADNAGGNAVWDPGEFPTNALSREKPESCVMEATTLDAELGKRVARPRLIKIDTEGAEQRVLEGAIGTLFEQRPPFIVAELHEFGLEKLGCSQRSLRELMLRAGYETFVLARDGSKPRLVKADQEIRAKFIVNLLFSTADEVDAIWAAEPARAVA